MFSFRNPSFPSFVGKDNRGGGGGLRPILGNLQCEFNQFEFSKEIETPSAHAVIYSTKSL